MVARQSSRQTFSGRISAAAGAREYYTFRSPGFVGTIPRHNNIALQ